MIPPFLQRGRWMALARTGIAKPSLVLKQVERWGMPCEHLNNSFAPLLGALHHCTSWMKLVLSWQPADANKVSDRVNSDCRRILCGGRIHFHGPRNVAMLVLI